MSRKITCLLAVLSIIFLFAYYAVHGFDSSPALAPQGAALSGYDSLDNHANEYVIKQMERHNVAGLSAAVVDGQQIVWSRGFGYANLEHKIPAAPDTVYKTGSISKLLNATAILRLKDEGRINLDTPLTTYIPAFSVKSRFNSHSPITLRSLLTHHSGLPSDFAKGMWGDTPEPFENIINILSHEYAAYPPGYIYSYSNIGSTLSGIAVQAVSGQDYVSFLDNHILGPLDMRNSSFAASSAIAGKLAKSYNKDKIAEKDVELRDIPAGNLYSTVEDLSKFLIMIFNNGKSGDRQFLSPDSVAEMITQQNKNNLLDGTFKIGLEFFLDFPEFDYAGGAIGHGGQTYLFHGQLLAAPQHKLGVVVLANSAGGQKTVKTIAGELLKAAIQIKTGLMPAQPVETFYSASAITAQPVPIEREGFYGTTAGLAEITGSEENLNLTVMGWRFRLVPRDNGWYSVQYRLAGLIPIPIDKLSKLAVTVRTINGEDVVFLKDGRKITAAGKKIAKYHIPAAWYNRLGTYNIQGYEGKYLQIDYLKLKTAQGYLLLEVASQDGKADLVLQPVTASEAVIFGLGRRMMETLRADDAPEQNKLVFAGLEFLKQTD